MKTSKFIGIFLILLFSLFSLTGCGFFTQNKEPTASLSLTPDTGTVPLKVEMNASSSHDPDGNIVSYDWSFGDGSNGSGEIVTHTYNTEGNYSVRLTVEDGGGASDSIKKSVEVKEGDSPKDNSIKVTIPEEVIYEDTDGGLFQYFTDPYYFVYVCRHEWISEIQSNPDPGTEQHWHSTSIGREGIVTHTFPVGSNQSCTVKIKLYDAGLKKSWPEELLAQNSWKYNITEGHTKHTWTEDRGGFKVEIEPA